MTRSEPNWQEVFTSPVVFTQPPGSRVPSNFAPATPYIGPGEKQKIAPVRVPTSEQQLHIDATSNLTDVTPSLELASPASVAPAILPPAEEYGEAQKSYDWVPGVYKAGAPSG